MPKLQTSNCSTCGQKAKEKSHSIDDFLNLRFVELQCGHIVIEPISESREWELLTSHEGYHLYPYQGEGYEFARKSNFRCLIGDEQGLGKTVQALACVKMHPELLPALMVVKSSLTMNWFKSTISWCGTDFIPDIIRTSKDRPSKGADVCIVTYDILNRISSGLKKEIEEKEKEIREAEGLEEWHPIPEDRKKDIPEYKNPFIEYGFKTVILDECQQIKNPQSKRANEVREICAKVPHVIALSGTPIKNNGGEYFTILNILDPRNFREYSQFIRDYCEYVQTQYGYKVGGIRNMESFMDLTKDYIIRRTRKEVLPDLPTLNRKFVHCDFASKKIEDDYKEMQEEFEDFFYENEGKKDFYKNVLDMINKMRHKVGQNKVPFCTEFVTDFILDTNRKIVIFIHHHDVRDTLNLSLIREFEKIRKEGGTVANPLLYTADLNPFQKDEVVTKFRDIPENRVLIASGLSAGEGINLQFCTDCIILERQWNPANESQMEGRFVRIGAVCPQCNTRQDSGLTESPKCVTCGYELKVDANYILTTGTIDEYFTELVEYKRSIMDSVLDGKVNNQWNEEGLMKELAQILAKKGGNRWRLK